MYSSISTPPRTNVSYLHADVSTVLTGTDADSIDMLRIVREPNVVGLLTIDYTCHADMHLNP